MSGVPLVIPPWTALTPYLVGARVTPTVPNATTWYATVGGTSGAAQPTWPVIEPWTIVDGTVTWRLASSFRQNAVAGILATLTAFRAANPTLLLGIAGARPKSPIQLDLPGAYVDSANETISFGGGIRTRTLSGLSVVVLIPVSDNNEASTFSDLLIDGLVDAFTAAYHSADGSSLTLPTTVTEEAVDEGGAHVLGQRITFGTTFKAEGRL